MFLEVPNCYLNHIPLFFKPFSLWSQIFLSRIFSDHRSRLILVVSVVLSCLGSSLLFSSLVWYIFILLPLFTFSCSGFRGSLVVIVCLLLYSPNHAYFLWAQSFFWSAHRGKACSTPFPARLDWQVRTRSGMLRYHYITLSKSFIKNAGKRFQFRASP